MNASIDISSNGLPSRIRPDTKCLRSKLDGMALEDDRTDSAPIDGLRQLVACGISQSVLPSSLGGEEFGWSHQSSKRLEAWLRTLGATHLSLARLYEGHVNAFQLIWTYGDASNRERLCRYVQEGGWLGVWNAPHTSGPLRLKGGSHTLMLDGMKAYASGAGLINRPLVTVQHDNLGLVMMWPRARYQVGSREEWEMHGMRASITLPVTYNRAPVSPDEIIGSDNDYHREPLFTTGAWRFLAAQTGAGERLAGLMALALTSAGRTEDPHQRERMAEVAMAIESSLQWLERARHAADGQVGDDEAIHIVRMARLAVERNLLAVLEQVHRSVGLASFRRDNPIERISRDLQTYLRQPAPDLVRDKVGEQAFGAYARSEANA